MLRPLHLSLRMLEDACCLLSFLRRPRDVLSFSFFLATLRPVLGGRWKTRRALLSSRVFLFLLFSFLAKDEERDAQVLAERRRLIEEYHQMEEKSKRKRAGERARKKKTALGGVIRRCVCGSGVGERGRRREGSKSVEENVLSSRPGR